MTVSRSGIPPIREVGPKLPDVKPVGGWPNPKPKDGEPFVRRPRTDGNPDRSGDRAK